MELFYLTLKQMLMMFSLIAIGFLFKKKRILPDDADTALAKLETNLFVPALSLYTLMTQCTVKTFVENSYILLIGFIITTCAILISYPLSKVFVRKSNKTAKAAYKRNIYKYALTFANFGFMGNFIILGVWGEEVFFKYILFTFFVSIFCYSWGMYILIPKDQNKGMLANLKNGLLKPPMIALVIGIIIGLFNLKSFIPDFILTAIDNAGKCQGPVAMVLAGIVIGSYNFKKLVTNIKVYGASIFRLIIIPAVMMLILKLLGFNDELMTLALICFATPLGLNTIVYPAAYGGETETGASMTMISHALAVITIPVMYLVFIVLL